MPIERDYHLSPADATDLCALYEPHPAWGERTREEVERIVEGSDEVVGLRDTDANDDADPGSLVAAARVLTDYCVQAMVYDVVVDESRRGERLGREVMAAVAGHPALDDVTLTLHCREGLVPFYERCGYALHDRDLEMTHEGETTTVTYRTMKLFRE